MHDRFDTDSDVKLNLRESSLLQKQWFTHVFEAVEKLTVRMEENTLQVQKEREEFFRSLVDLKEKLNEKILVVSKEHSLDLKELETKLAALIENVSTGFVNFSKSIDNSIDEHKTDHGTALIKLAENLHIELDILISNQKEINKKILDDVGTLKAEYTVIKTKFTVYVTLITLGTTTVIGVLATSLLVIFKDVLKAWLG